MKKFVFSLLFLCSLAKAQFTPTPNIGLQIPSNGSNNWNIPLNFNFNLLDQLLGGTAFIPSLKITNNLTVGGTVTANAFVGVGGTGFALTPGANRYSVPYFSTPTTSSTLAGAPMNGIPVYSSGSIPRVATYSDVSNLFTGCSSGSPVLQYDGTCSSGGGGEGLSGPYNITNQIAELNNGLIVSIGPPFIMSISCTASGTFEAGNATTSPNTCTLSYSNGTPASATLTDSQSHTGTISSPWTTGTLAYQYCTPGQGVSSFTFYGNATATNSQTSNASAGVNCTYREFGGVGTAGATGATASGTNAVLAGATGTLASAGFGQQSTWGPYSPSNQYIYVLGTSNSCTFTSGGFSFLMNAPVAVTFTNQFDAVIDMWLYGSVNAQNATTTLLGNC